MPMPQGTRVTRVSTSWQHVLVLTDTGDVLSFGMGDAGQLGHGDKKNRLVPRVIEALRCTRVAAIAAGIWHSMVLTDEGEVLSFGEGGCGCLGHGDNEDQLVPKVIEALRGMRVVEIAAGGLHSLVLTDEGIVLSLSDGEYGQLCHGDKEGQLVPKVIEYLSDERAVAISARDYNSMVLTDEGEVFNFGADSLFAMNMIPISWITPMRRCQRRSCR